MTTPAQSWWPALYDDLLADVLLERADGAELQNTLRFLTDALQLSPGARVFDQCCGIGSLSVPLAKHHSVVGWDLMPGYIERAQRAARAAHLEAELVAADAFHYTPSLACDAGFNWWTSFGYAPSDQDNLRMLQRAFEALRAGGRFALDFMNVPGILRAFQPHVVTRRNTSRGEVMLIRESRVDLAAMAMIKRWTYLLPDGQRVEHDSWVRLYLPHELAALLKRAGFEDVVLYGDLDKTPITLDSPRCIAVARRP